MTYTAQSNVSLAYTMSCSECALKLRALLYRPDGSKCFPLATLLKSSIPCWLQINGSLARAAIRELLEAGHIRVVAKHSKQEIYTRATNTEA